MSATISFGSSRTTRCWDRNPRPVTIKSSSVSQTAPLSATPNCALSTPTSTSASWWGSRTVSARLVPGISGTAEQITRAAGWSDANFACASVPHSILCAAPPASSRCRSNVAFRFISAFLKTGICGCSTRVGGMLARIAERICARLVLDILFLPVGDIPLTKGLLRDLRQFPIPPPRIQGSVVQEEMRCVVQHRPGCLFYGVEFFRMSEHMPRDREGKALGQRKIALPCHYSSPFQYLVADVDFHRADFRARSAQRRVKGQFAVFRFVKCGIENHADRTGIGRPVR